MDFQDGPFKYLNNELPQKLIVRAGAAFFDSIENYLKPEFCRKFWFESPAEAKKHAIAGKKLKIVVYKCPDCGKYHLSNKKKEPQKARVKKIRYYETET